jgi:hypothetical protein
MYWKNLYSILNEYLSMESKDGTYILCPFINPDIIQDMLSDKSDERVIIVTSWRKDHLLSGVSKLELYELVKENPKWQLYVNDNLHAKVYSLDLESGFLGSANLTYTGLMDDTKSNYEVLNYSKFNHDDSVTITRIIQSSILIDDSKYSIYLDWLEQNKSKYDLMLPRDSVIEQEARDWFKISSLPASISPSRIWDIKVNNAEPELDWGEDKAAEHDLELFEIKIEDCHDLNQFKQELAIKVSSHPFISSFTEAIDLQGMYFGRAKEWIQYNCTDDPVPYRRELTDYTDSLFNWLAELFPEDYIVERPNYSQLIRKSR